MAILLNRFGNCTDDILGTGSRACDLKDFGDVAGIGLFNKGFTLTLATDVITEASVENLIKGFSFFPLTGVYDFAQNTPENERNTSALGVMTDIRSGKPQFSFMFNKGGCFHKALYDKKGKDRWDLAIMFEKGILIATNVAGTKIKGFNMGMFSVETFKLLQGTDPQMSTATLQLLDAEEFNTRFTFFTYEELGFNFLDMNGVIEASLTYATTPTTGTTVNVKVTSACNVEDIILDLDDTASWRIGGTQTTPKTITAVAFNAVGNYYTLTLSSALIVTDTIQPILISAGGYIVAEDTLGNLFKGEASLATI